MLFFGVPGSGVCAAMIETPPTVDQYVSAVLSVCGAPDTGIVSAVLFGSAARGGYCSELSDVDLLIVVSDGMTAEDRRRVQETISELEARSGVAKRYPYRRGRLDAIADRITANVRSFFVCTRSGLLSGEPARILGITTLQALFVDRVAIPSILGSGVTIWGEHLLPHVPFLPIRRIDVAKAFFSFFNMVFFTALVYPLVPGATRYSMEALKRSIHNCYYCYNCRPARLSEEAAFFQRRIGPNAALAQLMRLRAAYQPSLGFVLRCFPTLVRLHLATALDNHFPRDPRAVIVDGGNGC